VIVLFLLFSSIFTFLLVLDIGSLQKNIRGENNVILLSDGFNFLSGAYTKFDNESINLENANIISNVKQLDNQDYSKILNGNYKLFIIYTIFLEDNLDQEVSYNGYQLTKNQVLNLLISQDPISEFSNTFNTQKEDIKLNDYEFKFTIFTSTINQIIKDQGLGVILKGYKNNQIVIYKETMFFKVIKFLPSKYLNNYITN